MVDEGKRCSLSLLGIEAARDARKAKGWRVEGQQWKSAMTRIIEPGKDGNEYRELYMDCMSQGNWHKFLRGARVKHAVFYKLCDLLNLDPRWVQAKNEIGWLEGKSLRQTREIKQIKDSGGRILTLVNREVSRDIERVSEINGVSKEEYLKFLTDLAWFVRHEPKEIKSDDLICMAKNYSLAKSTRKFPLKGMDLIGRVKGAESDVFTFLDNAISDYLVAKKMVASLNRESDLIEDFQTTYFVDMLIARIIEGSPIKYLTAIKFIKSNFSNEVSKFAAVNSMGILAKKSNIGNDIMLQQIMDYVFGSSDVENLYRSAVVRRVLAGNKEKHSEFMSSRSIDKLKREVIFGKDPIAAIFCIDLVGKQEFIPKLKNIFSAKYGDIGV